MTAPKVSVLCWAGYKYPASYLLGLLLSLERQTFKDFEVVVQTCGRREDIYEMLAGCKSHLPSLGIAVEGPAPRQLREGRILILPTDATVEARWGFQFKDAGIAACRGELLSFANDDSYLSQFFLQQMTAALDAEHDLVLCDMLHGLHGHNYDVGRPEVGSVCYNFMCKTALARSTPWPSLNPMADGEFVKALAGKCGVSRTAKVPRALYVYN